VEQTLNIILGGQKMLILQVFTVLLIVVLFFADRRKTLKGIKKGLQMFMNMLFPFLSIMIIISITLSLISKETIIKWLGNESGIMGFTIAALIGSVSLIPGFIAYPLCSVLLKIGVKYSTIAVFITTLTMVGVLTLPLEARYFGWKISVLRNLLCFAAAIIIGFSVDLIWKLI
jgi:uncharacterized membrane protein YraQ (UPF0718 family)